MIASSVSPYRWVVLAVYMLVTAVSQIMWMTFAPIARDAAAIYTGGNIDRIDYLAMLAMFSWLPFAIPAAWCIDRFGLKKGSGIGVVLIGVCGFLRIFAPSYGWLLACMIGCAVAQPFVLNAFTKLAAKLVSGKRGSARVRSSDHVNVHRLYHRHVRDRFHPGDLPQNGCDQAGNRCHTPRVWNTGPRRDDTVSCIRKRKAGDCRPTRWPWKKRFP